MISFKGEVIADSTGKWASNAVRFHTEAEATCYVTDLSMRWTSVRETRVVESDDLPNYIWCEGRALPIKPGDVP